MPLDPSKIQELLKKKQQGLLRKAEGTKGGRRKTKQINPNDRSYQAWFMLSASFLDQETREPIFCENPDCVDPRSKVGGQFVAEVCGKNMCRYCFEAGWLTTNPDQITTQVATQVATQVNKVRVDRV
jgi:hypothetical protein